MKNNSTGTKLQIAIATCAITWSSTIMGWASYQLLNSTGYTITIENIRVEYDTYGASTGACAPCAQFDSYNRCEATSGTDNEAKSRGLESGGLWQLKMQSDCGSVHVIYDTKLNGQLLVRDMAFNDDYCSTWGCVNVHTGSPSSTGVLLPGGTTVYYAHCTWTNSGITLTLSTVPPTASYCN